MDDFGDELWLAEKAGEECSGKYGIDKGKKEG